jgi:hypothetical protein
VKVHGMQAVLVGGGSGMTLTMARGLGGGQRFAAK